MKTFDWDELNKRLTVPKPRPGYEYVSYPLAQAFDANGKQAPVPPEMKAHFEAALNRSMMPADHTAVEKIAAKVYNDHFSQGHGNEND